MHRLSSYSTGFGMALAVFLPAVAAAEHPAVARAKAALESGRLTPERHAAPLLEALQVARTVDEKRELVGMIEDLGETDSKSPNAVKEYLKQAAVPVLLHVAKTGSDPFLQGDALSTLRGLGVSRSILEQAAAIAEADSNSFVQSRGEIMRNYIASMPAENEAAATRVVDPDKSRAAIAFLDDHGVGITTEALRTAARDALPEFVKALLDAGVAPDTGVTDLQLTPIYHATWLGCSNQVEETDWLVETVKHLVDAGANLELRDDNNNNVLIGAAQYCGPRVLALLIDGGAELNFRNGSGVSPLTIAFIMQRFDAAELMIAKGARLAKQDLPMVQGVMSDARARALVKKASGG
jgi:hypothetical protein